MNGFIETSLVYRWSRPIADPNGNHGESYRTDELEVCAVYEGDPPDGWTEYRTTISKEVVVVVGGQKRQVRGSRRIAFNAENIVEAFAGLPERVAEADRQILQDVENEVKEAQRPKLALPDDRFPQGFDPRMRKAGPP